VLKPPNARPDMSGYRMREGGYLEVDEVFLHFSAFSAVSSAQASRHQLRLAKQQQRILAILRDDQFFQLKGLPPGKI
jgi:hypothetical protein